MAKTIYSPAYRYLIDSLRQRRESLGLTQTQLAEVLGWPQQRVSIAETGARRLDVIEFLRWAEALRLTQRQAWQMVEQAMDRKTN
ncbi:MAG: helix-turn-helix domain-containing protein [Lysobacterales bacterium]